MPEFLSPRKGKIILESDSSYQNSQPGEFNDPLMSFVCSVPGGTIAESRDTDHLVLLDRLPPSFWAQFSNDTGKNHSAPANKIQIDPSKPLPRINQCPLNKEALWGIKPVVENFEAQGLVIPCTSPYHTPTLSGRKPDGRGQSSVRDL